MDSKNYYLCRICLRSVKPRKLLPLFDDEGINAERIKIITGIIIEESKELPSHFCQKCSQSFYAAMQIRSLCLASDRLLKKRLSDSRIIQTKVIAATAKTEANYIIEDHWDTQFVDPTCEPIDQIAINNVSEEEIIKPPLAKSVKERRKTCDICPICGKGYSSAYYPTHIITHNNSCKNTLLYECDLCNFKAKLKCYMYSHIRNMHISQKNWVCLICSKSYAKRHTYQIHMRSHYNDRPFKCDFEGCDKDFTQKNKLQVHQRIHNNIRPYTCKYCERTFIHYTDHKRHEYSHSNIKPYKCNHPECNRGFIKRSELTAHKKTHDNE